MMALQSNKFGGLWLRGLEAGCGQGGEAKFPRKRNHLLHAHLYFRFNNFSAMGARHSFVDFAVRVR